jgi:DNA polymerase V
MNKYKYVLPFTNATVRAGFPSPADDFMEERVDIFDRIVKHPTSTFLVRAKGDSMIGKGIQDGDILVVDKSVTAVNNSIVIAYIDGEFTVKRFFKESNRVVLYPANDDYKPMYISDTENFLIWGVVTFVLHECI